MKQSNERTNERTKLVWKFPTNNNNIINNDNNNDNNNNKPQSEKNSNTKERIIEIIKDTKGMKVSRLDIARARPKERETETQNGECVC